MNIRYALAAGAALVLSAVLAYGQATVVINDPTAAAKATTLSPADEALINRDVLPKLKKQFADDTCEVEIQLAGVIQGAFTRRGAKQKLAFFQICQTGNGMG